jgi:hypothetical protein
MSAPELTRVAVTTVVLLSAGCSTQTTSAEVWKSPSYEGGPKTSVIVFGGRMNEATRRTVEDAFVRALTAHGVHAAASYTVFPGQLPDLDTARQQVMADDYNGVLVSTMRGVTERTTIQPGTAYAAPFWGGYYGPGWGSAWNPAYVETDRFVKFETTLWDVQADSRMIWSDVTRTENPTSTPGFTKSLLESVIPAMEKAGLLPRVTPTPISVAPQPGTSLPMQAAGR